MKAVEFAETGLGGLVLKLAKKQSKGGENVTKFECELFSCYPEEQETLFFGGDTELKIMGIIQWAKGKWRSYDKFMEPINAFHRMMNGKSLNDRPIWSNTNDYVRHKTKMNCIVKDLLYVQSKDAQLECPQYVLSLAAYQLKSTKHIRLNWNEMKSGYQWMSCILKSESTLNLANIAALFSDATSITFELSDGVDLEEEEWESVVSDFEKIREMGLFMKVRFELSSDEYSL